jgi:[acyl-carrier-protein] S-malonyltransferase
VFLSNAAGRPLGEGGEILAALVSQVTRPVRWDLVMRTMAELGLAGLVELAPGGVLAGLARRELPGVPAVALKSPADLDQAAELAGASAPVGSGV